MSTFMLPESVGVSGSRCSDALMSGKFNTEGHQRRCQHTVREPSLDVDAPTPGIMQKS
jgi:hypothetical protein